MLGVTAKGDSVDTALRDAAVDIDAIDADEPEDGEELGEDDSESQCVEDAAAVWLDR